MAKNVNIRESIAAEKKLFTSPQYRDIQESLARGGRIRAEDLPLNIRRALDLSSGQNMRLSRRGYENFINDRMNADQDPTSWKQTPEDIQVSMVAGDNLQRGTRGMSVAERERLQLIARSINPDGARTTAVGVKPVTEVAPKGTVVENAGELDYSGIKGLVNQLNNLLRPIARKAAILTPVGGVGEGIAETIQGIKEKQFADNPLSRLLSNTMKGVKKSVAGIGEEGEGLTIEQKLNAFLESKYPELVKKRPTNVLSNRSAGDRGLNRFTGIGEIKSPYGRFIFDESGTLRKI